MKAAEKRERLVQIQAYAKALVQGVRIMDERRHILQPLLRNKYVRNALAEKFNNTFGVNAYNHLAPLLAQDLVGDLARLYLDEDRRAASFVNLYRKAANHDTHSALKDQFRHIPDQWHEQRGPIPGLSEEESRAVRDRWHNKDKDDFEKSFNDGWNTVTTALNTLKNDPIAEKIKTLRDKYHAHLEMAPIGNDPGPLDVAGLGLTYNDLLIFADRYMGDVFELARIVTGNVHDVKQFSDVHQKCGEDMWRILAGLE